MKSVIKNIVGRTYKPLLEKYLSKTRTYHYENISLQIAPEVFHPGFFHSTIFLLKWMLGKQGKGKTLLELGAGSGLIAFKMAESGLNVTASDINPVAISLLKYNSEENKIKIEIIKSDLFENLENRVFDFIVINPPYFKKNPETLIEMAWYCGENGEYFSKLFSQLRGHINSGSEVYMVLCDGCDMDQIKNMAMSNGFTLELMKTKKTLLEKSFIYAIR